VAATIQSSGDIESICQAPDAVGVGQVARIIFRAWDDVTPPFTVKVRGPDGKLVVDRVIRELPTGRPQSAPPVTFSVTMAGDYQIEIKELYGKAEGAARFAVS
jgi:hypothetical protein